MQQLPLAPCLERCWLSSASCWARGQDPAPSLTMTCSPLALFSPGVSLSSAAGRGWEQAGGPVQVLLPFVLTCPVLWQPPRQRPGSLPLRGTPLGKGEAR